MAIVYNLDLRCQNILKMIINAQGYLKIKDIALENGVSIRSIYYDIEKINDWLKTHNVKVIVIERRRGIIVSSDHALEIKKVLDSSNIDIEYLFTPPQRVKIIVCSILKKEKALFIEDFMSLCKVSRNTIISDLKAVIALLEEYQLVLHYENKNGYEISGQFIKKVSLFFLFFYEMSEFYRKGIIYLDNKEKIYEISERLNHIEKLLHTKYVSGVLFGLATFCASITENMESFHFALNDTIEIKETKEYQLVKKYCHDFTEGLRMYISLHLLGSRLQTVPINLMVDGNEHTYELSKKLVDEFSIIACVEFPKKEAVIAALFAHLRTSLYRYKYGIQLVNPMLEGVKKEYRELFELTKKSCNVLKRELGYPIPESEIAYITLHFGGYIVDTKEAKQELSVLIICPNGVSTGKMLKAEIHSLLPHTTKIDTIMLSQFIQNHCYDVVISTVEVPEYLDTLIVHPILTDNDRITILRKCMAYSKEQKAEIDEIMILAQRYMDTEGRLAFRRDLQHYFTSFSTANVPRRNFGLGLINHLTANNIMICNNNYYWQEAIQLISVPLLDSACIEEQYVENIIKKCNIMGPYMFITENVVLAHAGIDDGVNHLGLSLAIFKQPVYFNAHRKATIILVLATTDQVSHIRILDDVMTIFKNNKNIKTLQCKKKPSEVLAYIHTLLIQ